VLRRERLAGFSMRKLAEELGATPMAVYRYFPNKGALLDALVDRGLDGAALPAMGAASWQERGRMLASFYRARLLESPETMPWVLSRVGVSPAALRSYEAALAVVRESGLPDKDVVRVVDAMVSYVMGFVAIEVARQGAGTRGRGYRSLVPQFLQLPSDEYPTLVALAAHAGDFDDELFAFGLDLLLAGAQARVSAAATATATRKRSRA
jgi:TetR/AcrR family tetracycline transcriptional repressor